MLLRWCFHEDTWPDLFPLLILILRQSKAYLATVRWQSLVPGAEGSLGFVLLQTLLFKNEMPYNSDEIQQSRCSFVKKDINTAVSSYNRAIIGAVDIWQCGVGFVLKI